MTTTPEAILRAELDSAERMIFHLKRSYSQAATLLPLSSQQVAKLTDDEIDRLDLYLSRFGKLQDFMTGKLFRALARASLEDIRQDVSLLDTLNRMEKFGIVEDQDAWLKARLLRNAFAHEYLTDNEAIAENINEAWALFPLLERTLRNAHRFYEQHIRRG
ncbi:MAG: hypothetical protein JXR29_13205 [Methylothermaceae bacterium]|nr:hypothetical protein [Methylothermaceae bacterium]